MYKLVKQCKKAKITVQRHKDRFSAIRNMLQCFDEMPKKEGDTAYFDLNRGYIKVNNVVVYRIVEEEE